MPVISAARFKGHIRNQYGFLRIRKRLYITGSAEIIAAKLELGPVQTLAHKEGDTWVLNDPPPNKALELLKCQRYSFVINDITSRRPFIGSGLATASKELWLEVPCPTPLRAMPSISTQGTIYCRTSAADLNISNAEYHVTQMRDGLLTVRVISPTDMFTPGSFYQVFLYGDGNARVIIDSNL